MQGYYIHYKGRIPIGVSKKIDMILKEFSKFSDIEEIDLTPSKCSICRSVLAFLPFINIKRNYKKAYEHMEKHNPDYIYIRRTTADKGFMNFIKNIRKTYPSCKIIVEIMSYPYDKEEFFNIIYWPYYFKEIINRKKYKLYIDKFITYTEDCNIFGVDTIKTLNGITVDNIVPVSYKKNEYSGINLIAVAGMYKFHGYERLIYGLHDYSGDGNKRKVFLHFVGDGPELSKYKKLAKCFHLENQIIFYGKKYGKELDDIYNGMDIAISSLGLYKLGFNMSSSLKLNEYLAKGLPIVVAGDTAALTGKKSMYYLQLENDKSPVDINVIVNFYDKIYMGSKERKDIVNDIRQLAYKTVDMSITLSKIRDYIVE